MPLDSAGFPILTRRQQAETAPLYELEGFALGRALAAAPDLSRALGPVWPSPDIESAARWMVSVAFWREFLFENQAHGSTDAASYREEAAEFAAHIAAGMTALLRPWLAGRVRMRPGVLRRLTQLLDRVQDENLMINYANERGEVSELAIFEIAGSDKALEDHLRRYRDEQREAGMPEVEIAARIRRGAQGDADAE